MDGAVKAWVQVQFQVKIKEDEAEMDCGACFGLDPTEDPGVDHGPRRKAQVLSG